MRSGLFVVRKFLDHDLADLGRALPLGSGDTHPVILEGALTLHDALFLERNFIFRGSPGPHS
jgi:hypothetical protein